MKLTFLHTGAVHIPVFEQMLEDYDHGLEISHLVGEEFLTESLARGGVGSSLKGRIQAKVSEAIEDGADLVLCTCSSIGAAVEDMNEKGAVATQRIDRAMADEAVRLGGRITVCAALASTVRPTKDLLLSSAENLGKTIEVDTLLIPDAWARFEAGDKEGYCRIIARTLDERETTSEVIVLAQASMAGALDQVKRKEQPILTSPRMGLERALKVLGALKKR